MPGNAFRPPAIKNRMKMMRKLFLLFCLLCSASLQAQALWGPMSKVVTDSIYSENLKAWRAYTIYLPKSYEAQPDRKYPILYLLHGVIGTNLGWFHDQRANEVADQLMDSGEACEMIIVSPNAGGNPPTKYQNGYFNMPGWPYEDFFYQEFMPYIEKTYRVIGDKQHRAIAGLSMGGYHSLHISKQYPDMFNYVGLFSAAIMPDQKVKSPIYDDFDQKLATQFAKKPALYWIGIGKTDFLYQANTDYRKLLDERGYKYEYYESEGGHIWRNWRIYLTEFAPKLFK